MSEPGNSTGDLLDALRDDVRELIRQELQNVQGDMQGKARQLGKSALTLGSAGLLGALAAGSAGALLLRLLDRFLPPRLSAFVATALLGGGAAGLALVGVEELRRARPTLSDATLARAQGDVHAARASSEKS